MSKEKEVQREVIYQIHGDCSCMGELGFELGQSIPEPSLPLHTSGWAWNCRY